MADDKKSSDIDARIDEIYAEPVDSTGQSEKVLSPEEVLEVNKEIEDEAKYGDADLRTFAESAASAASFGLTDQILTKSGLVSKEDLRERRARNQAASISGEITGIAIPALLTGGETLAAKALASGVKGAARAGGVVEKLTASGLKKLIAESGNKKIAAEVLKRSVSKGLGSAVEGSFYGAGKLISEEALGNADFNAENLITHTGAGAILGGLAGGAMGAAEVVVPIVSKQTGKITGYVHKRFKDQIEPNYQAQKLAGLSPAEISKQNAIRPDVVAHTPKMLREVAESHNLSAFSDNQKLHKSVGEFATKTGDDIGNTLDEITAQSNPSQHVVKTKFEEVSPDEFFANIDKFVKEPHKLKELRSANISRYTAEEYKGMRTVLSADRKSGYAIKPDGELVSVHSFKPGRGDDLVADSIESGASYLDAYDIDGKLPSLYNKHGFHESERSLFMAEYADATNKMLNAKKPDFVRMDLRTDFLPMKTEVADNIIRRLEKFKSKFLDSRGSVLKTAEPTVTKINKIITGFEKDLLSGRIMGARELNTLKAKYQKLAKWDKRGQLPVSEEINREISRALREEVLKIADKAPGEAGARLRKQLLDYGTSLEFLGNFSKKIDKQSSKEFLSVRDLFLGSAAGFLDMGTIGAGAIVTKKFLQSDLRRKLAILTNMERANQSVIGKVSSSINNFAKGTVKPVKPVTTRLLLDSGFSYKQEDGKKPKKPKDAKEAFQNLETNLHTMTDPDQNQRFLNRGNISIAAPETSDYAQHVLISAAQFLSDKLPSEAANTGTFAHLTRKWQPSTQEIAKFERYLKAIENPLSILTDLENGKINREGVEAIKAVYPNLYHRIQSKIMEKIAADPESIDYQKRLQLGILLDVPTDAALVPQNILALQEHFKESQVSQAGGGKVDMGRAKSLDMSETAATSTQKVRNRV